MPGEEGPFIFHLQGSGKGWWIFARGESPRPAATIRFLEAQFDTLIFSSAAGHYHDCSGKNLALLCEKYKYQKATHFGTI
jgi:hypothetical protein